MKSKIINICLNDNIVEYTTKYIVESINNNENDFGKIAVVMPSKRPAMFIKRELAKQINKSFIPPKFFTFDELVNLISAAQNTQKISKIDSSYIIYDIVHNKLKTSNFYEYTYSSFFQWANEILNFINLLDLEQISNDKLLNIQMQAEIGFDVPESINELLKNISFIREEFHERIKQLNKTTTAYSYYNAKKYIEQYFKDFDKVILFNPYYLNKSETEMFKVLFDSGKLDIIIRGNKNNWQYLNKIYKDFNCASKPVKDNLTDNIKFYSAYDGYSQACLVKNLIQKIPQTELKDTVVIVPDNTILQAVTSELYSIMKDINIAVGYPANKTTVFSLMKDLIKTHLNRDENNKYYVKDFVSIISNPLVKNIRFIGISDITRIIVHEIINNFDFSNKKALFKSYQFISLEEIQNNVVLHENISKKITDYWQEVSPNRVKELITELFDMFFYKFENISTMAALGKAVNNIADIITQKSLINSYSFNLGAMNMVYDIANQFLNSLCSNNIFAQKELLKIFENLISTGNINLVGSPLKGLQVLGFMESRGLSFKNVFIVSMSDSVVPNVREINPLIPKEVINLLNMGYSERESDIQKYQFYGLISGAKSVSLIYPNDNVNIRSRFIEELVWKKQYETKLLKSVTVNNAVLSAKLFSNNKPEIVKTDEIKKYLLNFKYSATNIDAYMKCKLLFYYKYVLKLGEQTDYDDDYENINIGNCVHDFLNETFHSGLTKEMLIGMDKNVYEKKLDDKINEYFKNGKTGKMYLLRKLLKKKLNDFMKAEIKRDFKQVLDTEKDFSSKVEVNGTKYNLVSRMDRIDENEDGTISIIDYKTGNAAAPVAVKNFVSDESSLCRQVIAKNIKSFQLIIYKYLYEQLNKDKVVRNAMLYSLKDSKTTLLLKQDSKIDFSVLLEQFKLIISDINNDEPFRSELYDDVECEKCPYFYLCRQ
ncbi:MAG: PD-(D/E)XK nuclease family protein [Elusimicrobia bacterium]|nr:PD-(D/E)XK nuclease family protein [Elusimicrobiota bacterium]